MFEQLPLIGEGLVMTRNEAAILGRRMTFPDLAFTAHGIKGASERGGSASNHRQDPRVAFARLR